MAERFQTVFTLPENLYLEGAPVRITAGALQRIAANGQMLAQVTLQNIGSKPVKGAKIVIRPLDVAGRPLGLPTIFPILDFYAERGAFFGQDAMIPLPDFSTRRIAAFVTEVIFADDTVWAAPAGGEWTPMEPQKPLAEALGDPEMVKQYRLRFGEDAEYQPDRVADLWRCACGAVNRKDENICHACRKVAGALFDPELMQELGKEKDARLEAERIEREAREEEARKKAEEKKAAAEAARKKLVKILKIAVPALVAVIAAVLIVTKVVIPNSSYNKAVALLEDGKYKEAAAAFDALGDYKDSKDLAGEAQEKQAAAEKLAEVAEQIAEAEALEKDGKIAEAAMAFYALKEADPSYLEHSFALWDKIAQRKSISSVFDIVGLRSDGTVIALGKNNFGEHDVSDWTNIIDVSSANVHTVGLRDDGTAVATGSNKYGQCNLTDFTDCVAISACGWHTVGVRADGTVVAAGCNEYGESDVSDWTGIVAVSAGWHNTVGLRANGTVVAFGDNSYGESNVAGWKDIVAVSAGRFHTVGLRADGTVVAVGDNEFGQCDVSDWTDIVAVSAGQFHTVGLRADGTVVAVGNNDYGQCDVSSWSDIVAISAGGVHTLGLRADGSAVAIGDTEDSRCDVSDWTDMKLPSNKK